MPRVKGEGRRTLMRDWLMEQVSLNYIKGLDWLDEARTLLRIPWKHASRRSWNSRHDACLFMRWAIHTEKFTTANGANAKKWKANFRCALNSLPDVREVETASSKATGKEGAAFRTYQFLPAVQRRAKHPGGKSSLVKKKAKRRSSSMSSSLSSSSISSRSMSRDHLYPHHPQTSTIHQQLPVSSISSVDDRFSEVDEGVLADEEFRENKEDLLPSDSFFAAQTLIPTTVKLMEFKDESELDRDKLDTSLTLSLFDDDEANVALTSPLLNETSSAFSPFSEGYASLSDGDKESIDDDVTVMENLRQHSSFLMMSNVDFDDDYETERSVWNHALNWRDAMQVDSPLENDNAAVDNTEWTDLICWQDTTNFDAVFDIRIE